MQKFFVAILAFLLFTSSCSENKLSAERIGELEAEVETLKDSIDHLMLYSNPKLLTEGYRIDTSRGIFGNLYADTLILEAEFDNCGEFGGNREMLKIFWTSNVLYCRASVDAANCNDYNPKTRYTPLPSELHVLDESDEKAIMNYLHKLTEFSFLSTMAPLSNATRFYSAKLVPNDQTLSMLNNFETFAIDFSLMWPEYFTLRNRITN